MLKITLEKNISHSRNEILNYLAKTDILKVIEYLQNGFTIDWLIDNAMCLELRMFY
jgi:hypothetical protein